MKQLNHLVNGVTKLKWEAGEGEKDICTDKIFILTETSYFSSRISILLKWTFEKLHKAFNMKSKNVTIEDVR